MKYLLIIIGFLSLNLQAQNTLNYDKRFIDCEDQWVAFQMNKDSTYIFGFIYIDTEAGLTLNYEGTFRINKDNIFIPKKIDTAFIKYRLEPNQTKVAFIPETRFKELNIKKYPDWLSIYKSDSTSANRLFRLGFVYNEWTECTKALTYLEKVKKINPKFRGLDFEFSFAYNALGWYDKAILVLEDAIKTSPDDYYLYKELSYAQMNLGRLENAAETCKKGIAICTDKPLNSEMAHNMAYHYYKIKDKVNFKYWADETKKWAKPGDRFMVNIKQMEEDIEK